MIQSHKLPSKVIKTVVISCTLGLSLAFSATVLAGTFGATYYNPRNPSRPVTRTGSGATRGGCEEATQAKVGTHAGLVALAPKEHVGRTSSTHPTFVWFVPDGKSYPMELTLYESGAKGRGKPIQTIQMQSSPGLMKWSLPADQPGLSVGKRYLWQVALICNPNRPSKDQWMEAEVEVVEAPADLKAALSTMNDPLKQAVLYSQAGLWYDAISETLRDANGKAVRLTLLEQLSQMESPEQRTQLRAVLVNEQL